MDITEKELHQFVDIVKKNSIYDLSGYSEKSLARRIDKVLLDNTCSLNQLLYKIADDSTFLETVVKQITVNTTELFRDTHFWQDVRFELLPKFVENTSLSILHAGASSGQEVYSMLILLHELGMLEKSHVYATDINENMISVAQNGEYPYRFYDSYKEAFHSVIKDNPFGKPFKHKPFEYYFESDAKKSYIQINQKLSEHVHFYTHDLVSLQNPMDTKFDIILCRNVLIYFKADLQKKIYNFFYKNMQDDAYLALGMQESMGWFMSTKFQKFGRFYKKIVL
ncbi:MAG: hypothetical protein PF481_03710 [Bacteroidales bacterium]|jgi:chemotaxis protein methyltransferase CheR|nr:hypothetical protein [Bacteroidales bacterium]